MRECTVRTGRLPIRVWQSAVRVGQSSNPRNAIECSAVGINVPCGEDRRSARGGMSVARGGITCAIGRVSVEPCASASHAVTSTIRLGEAPARASRVIVARAAVSVPPGAVVCAAMAIQRCHQGNENIAPFSRRGARGVERPGATGRRRVASNTFDRAGNGNRATSAVSVPDGAVAVSSGAVDVEQPWSHRNDRWIRRRENRVRAPSASERRALKRNRSLRFVGSARVGDRTSGMT